MLWVYQLIPLKLCLLLELILRFFFLLPVIPRVVDNVLNLGFKLSLDPGAYIEYVCCIALKMLGFVMRLVREFRLGISVKTLYCTLVHPILEFGVVV